MSLLQQFENYSRNNQEERIRDHRRRLVNGIHGLKTFNEKNLFVDQ